MMARVQREGQRAEKSLRAEQGAREERNNRYDDERLVQEAADKEEEDDDDRTQFMAMDVPSWDDTLPHSLEYSNLFSLDDPVLEAELMLMSSPISDSVEELRNVQRASNKREETHDWYTVGKGKILPLPIKNKSYANAVKTCYGVTSLAPTPEFDPSSVRRSPRVQKRVRFSAKGNTPPQDENGTKKNNRQTSTTPPLPPSPVVRRAPPPEEGGEMYFDNENELVRLRMTFSLKDLGAPTPGTTFLDQPPEGGLPPPPLSVPDNVTHSASTSGPSPPKKLTLAGPYTHALSLCNSLKVVTAHANRFKDQLYELVQAE